MGKGGGTPERSGNPRPGAAWRFVPWGVAAYLLAGVPLILSGLNRGRGQFDQQFFHEPTIRAFASQWPRVDLSDYLSATTPGYHVAMAAVAKYLTGSLVGLKLASAVFTVGLLWVLEGAVRANRLRARGGTEPALRAGSPPPPPPGPLPPGGGVLLVLPMVCSMYVLMPGVWLQPDNAGWLGVLLILLIALRRRWDEMSLAAGALVMLLLVWTRQSHVWAAGVLWVAAWVRSEEGIKAARHRGIEVGLAVLSTMPALVCLGWFAALWGGLTPPEFQKQHAAGWNAAMPAFALALWAVLSVFFGAWVWGGLRSLARSWRGWVMMGACAAAGAALAVIPETTFLYESRATGLWNLVKAMDGREWIIAGRTSPLILALAPLGAVTMAAWLAAVARSGPDGSRRAWIYGLALAGFVAAQTANTNAWQRYLEPMFLMVMALMAAEIGWPRGWRRWMAWAGPIALAALGALLTAYTLWREPVVVKTW